MSTRVTCWRCAGGQTEPGTYSDLCRECGGDGELPASLLACEEPAPPLDDADMPLDARDEAFEAMDAQQREMLRVRTAFGLWRAA